MGLFLHRECGGSYQEDDIGVQRGVNDGILLWMVVAEKSYSWESKDSKYLTVGENQKKTKNFERKIFVWK